MGTRRFWGAEADAGACGDGGRQHPSRRCVKGSPGTRLAPGGSGGCALRLCALQGSGTFPVPHPTALRGPAGTKMSLLGLSLHQKVGGLFGRSTGRSQRCSSHHPPPTVMPPLWGHRTHWEPGASILGVLFGKNKDLKLNPASGCQGGPLQPWARFAGGFGKAQSSAGPGSASSLCLPVFPAKWGDAQL